MFTALYVFMPVLKNLLKFAPYLFLIGLVLFGLSKLQSCSQEKEYLEKKVETQAQNNTVLKDANKENTDSIAKLEKSSNASLNTVTKQNEEEKKISSADNARELAVKKKLAEVINDYNKSAKDLLAINKKHLEISVIQIGSIWESYCASSPSDNQCKEPS